MSDSLNENKSVKLIQIGAETFGAAIGGAIGLLGGPLGSIGGSVAGVLISKGLSEFANRFLSYREQARVGAGAALTILGLQQNLKNGLTLRQDGFFNSSDFNRSKAEELFEGVLIKCKNEFEEKKIKYISNIYKNVAFDGSINPDNANQILNFVQQHSFRQLSILSFIGQNNYNKLSLKNYDYREDYEKVTTQFEFILQDFVLLHQQGLIYRFDYSAVLDASDIIPGKTELTKIGNEYYKLLDLEKMSETEFSFLEQLKQ